MGIIFIVSYLKLLPLLWQLTSKMTPGNDKTARRQTTEAVGLSVVLDQNPTSDNCSPVQLETRQRQSYGTFSRNTNANVLLKPAEETFISSTSSRLCPLPSCAPDILSIEEPGL